MLPSSARRMSTNRYKDEQVTLTSDHAEWTELTFSLRDGETQIVDYNGLADSRDHEAQFSFEIVKSGNEFNFKNHHGFDWVDLSGSCGSWESDEPQMMISEAGILVKCSN